MTEQETTSERAVHARSGTGFAVWRQIAEQLRRDITTGLLVAGDRLPPESALAQRFDVNRHTVRAALASLAEEGLVQARQGSGTYVAHIGRIAHTIGLRTRLTESLRSQGVSSGTRMLLTNVEHPPPAISRMLDIGERPALRVESLRLANSTPILRATHWFDPARVPHFSESFSKTGSITAALAADRITDYVRTSTTISARHADMDEVKWLALPAGSVVLVVNFIDSLVSGEALQVGITRFAADRVELALQPEADHPAT
jgi:GntR family phosphonate transport system transcriptional regulator